MRILVLTQVVVYPADAGPKIKTLQVIRHLAAEHEVLYCTFVRNQKEQQNARKLSKFCTRVSIVPIKRSLLNNMRFLVESFILGDSFLLRRDNSSAMRATVSRLLLEERIDVIHVDQLNMMCFVPPDWPGPVILDEHNAVWKVVERLRKGTHNPIVRWFLGREVGLIRELEGKACRRSQVVLAVSERDKRALQEVAGTTVSIKVVPITVDMESLEAIWLDRDPQPNRLLSIGTMFWPPNSEGIIWWLSNGYASLCNVCPDLSYDIVGSRPPYMLRALARRCKGVSLHGYVSDVEPFWTKTTALLVPLLSGGGVRVKILEAMAMGIPVISTTIGCEGLMVRDGEHLLVADTPEAFVNACLTLLQDKELAYRLSRNARQLILEKYDARVALRALDDAYEQVMEEKKVSIGGRKNKIL